MMKSWFLLDQIIKSGKTVVCIDTEGCFRDFCIPCMKRFSTKQAADVHMEEYHTSIDIK